MNDLLRFVRLLDIWLQDDLLAELEEMEQVELDEQLLDVEPTSTELPELPEVREYPTTFIKFRLLSESTSIIETMDSCYETAWGKRHSWICLHLSSRHCLCNSLPWPGSSGSVDRASD